MRDGVAGLLSRRMSSQSDGLVSGQCPEPGLLAQPLVLNDPLIDGIGFGVSHK
jgi:hypothetical protein